MFKVGDYVITNDNYHMRMTTEELSKYATPFSGEVIRVSEAYALVELLDGRRIMPRFSEIELDLMVSAKRA